MLWTGRMWKLLMNFLDKNYFHTKNHFPKLVESMNKLLLSSRNEWDGEMIKDLFMNASDRAHQLKLFQTLLTFIKLYEVPVKVVQVVQNWLVKGVFPWFRSITPEDRRLQTMPVRWQKQLRSTQEAYGLLMAAHIMSLEPGKWVDYLCVLLSSLFWTLLLSNSPHSGSLRIS